MATFKLIVCVQNNPMSNIGLINVKVVLNCIIKSLVEEYNHIS